MTCPMLTPRLIFDLSLLNEVISKARDNFHSIVTPAAHEHTGQIIGFFAI